MAILTELERRELLELAVSPALGMEMRILSRRRVQHFWIDGKVDIDRVVDFLMEFNSLINHQPKAFRKIKDHTMKL